MAFTLCAFNHDEWQRHGLADFSDFAEQISECSVGEDAFSGYGKWFFVPDDPLPNGDRVIYFGSWGNENSPGASSYTHAEIFSIPDEAKTFEQRVRDWESQPEYDDSESEDWDDDEQSDDKDIPF